MSTHTTNAIVQTAKLVTLGDAIRAKAGLSAEMTLDEMAAAVANIETGGGGTPYDGSHHRSPAGYLVVCMLTQGSSTSYFNYCKIYECTNGVKGTLLDSFPSPESQLLVAVTTPQLYFEFSSNGYLTQGNPRCTGGVSYNYDTDDSTYWIVNVSGDGTVTFESTDWDD